MSIMKSKRPHSSNKVSFPSQSQDLISTTISNGEEGGIFQVLEDVAVEEEKEYHGVVPQVKAKENKEADEPATLSSPSSPPQSRPILRRSCLEEIIPINTSSKAWKNLPSPCLGCGATKMKRVESLNSYLHHLHDDTNPADTTTTTPSIIKRTTTNSTKGVRFQEITIREYDITMGDNPSVSKGVPISIGWNYEEYPTLALDEYEANKLLVRQKSQMKMSTYQRKNLLIYQCGFTEQEVQAASKQADRDKTKRVITTYIATTPGLSQIEDAATSLGRKAKRMIFHQPNNKGRSSNLMMKKKEGGFKPLRLMPRRRRSVPSVLVHEDNTSIRSAATV